MENADSKLGYANECYSLSHSGAIMSIKVVTAPNLQRALSTDTALGLPLRFRVNSTRGQLDTCVELTVCRVDSCVELTLVKSTHGQLDTSRLV